MQGIAANVASVGAFLLGLVFQVLTIGLFTFYLVADGPRFRRGVCSLLPPRVQRDLLAAWDVAIDKTGGYLYSRLLLAILNAGFSFIVLQGSGSRSRPRSRCGRGSSRSSSPWWAPTSPRRSRCSWRCSRTRGRRSGSDLRDHLPADRELPARAAHHGQDDAAAPAVAFGAALAGVRSAGCSGAFSGAARPRR